MGRDSGGVRAAIVANIGPEGDAAPGERGRRTSLASWRRVACATCVVASALLAGCYPRYDWRDYRPDCARTWCGFVASFPGRVTTATRDIPVGALRLPLALHVVSVGDVTFAVGAFELVPGSDAAAAQALLERKLLDDVGAASGRRDGVAVRTADHGELVAERFEADGARDGRALHATARLVRHRGRLVEILVIGPAATLATDSGRQAIETFVTSLRLD